MMCRGTSSKSGPAPSPRTTWLSRGSPSGQNRLASSWLTITTPGDRRVSWPVKSRPRMRGVRKTLKYSGVTTCQPPTSVSSGRPTTLTLKKLAPPKGGPVRVAPTASTPGRPLTAWSPFSTNCVVRSVVLRLLSVTGICIVRARRASNPGSTRRSSTKLRIRRAAPITSTTVSATSVTTRIVPERCWRPVEPNRPLERSWVSRFVRAPRHAERRPHATPHVTDTVSAKSRIRQSIVTFDPSWATLGMLLGSSVKKTRIPARPSGRPMAPATTARIRLSVSI